MASVSITHLVIFIASLLVAASVAGVLTDEVGRISESISAQGLDASEQVRTDVEIISDAGAGDIYDSTTDNITLYVKNTGTQELATDDTALDVLVDGEYHGGVNITVVDGSSWDRNNVARVRIYDPDLGTGDHRVKLIANGDEEVFEFDR